MDKDSNKAFQQYILVKNPYRNAVAALIYASFINVKEQARTSRGKFIDMSCQYVQSPAMLAST